jgi:hypothetical protein
MSTPGPERIPTSVKVDKTSGQGKPPAGGTRPGAKGGSGGGGKGPGAKKGGKGRKPITPVKAAGGTNWGPLAVAGVVVLVAVGIIGFGVFYAVQQNAETSTPWEERAAAISDIVNYRESDPEMVKGSQHQAGTLQYKVSPPVAGAHNAAWQNCNGDVYDAPIANEHAVHSLEHGAIWITYKPNLPADQVQTLVSKVQGKEKMLISPYSGALDKNISVQAWGYQIKADSASDPRIDDFIQALRVNASIEGPTAACDGGVTATGTAPQGAGAPMGS